MSYTNAGGEDKLRVTRTPSARRESVQHERRAEANILPGQAVMPSTDADGKTYALHDGAVPENDVHVANEARGRGMQADTSDGYPAGELMYGLDPHAGGFNVRVAAGENVADTDPLVVDPGGSGNFLVYDSGTHSVDDIVAHAAEDADLSAASDPALVAVDME